MPLLTDYERTYSAPPEPIGYERDDHDPHDDRHPDDDETETTEFDWNKGWTDLPQTTETEP